MKENQHLSMRQGYDHGSLNFKGTNQNNSETINTCAINPCAMKAKSKNSAVVKCPECGKTNVPN